VLERQSWIDFFKANTNPNLVYRAQYILFLVKRIDFVYYIPKDTHCSIFGLSYSDVQDSGLDITINLQNCLDWHVCDVNPIFNVETIKTLNNGNYKDKILYTKSGSIMKIFSADETGVRLVDMQEYPPHSLNCVSYQTLCSNLYYDRFHQVRALYGYESI